MMGLSLNYHRNVWRNMSANIFQPINHADPNPTQNNEHGNQSIPTVHVMTLFADLLYPMTPITLLGHGKKGAIKGLTPTYMSQNRGFHSEIKGFLGTTWDIIRIYPSSSRASRGQKFQKK